MQKVELFKKFNNDFFDGELKAGDIILRDQLADFLNGEGYSERTVLNMLYPSRKDGFINSLIQRGVLVKQGFKKWIYQGEQKLDEAVGLSKVHFKNRKKTIKSYQGSPCLLAGWITEANLSEPDSEKKWSFSYRDDGTRFSVKVFCEDRVEHKANYWVMVHKETWNISGTDAGLLKSNHPVLADNLISDLKDISVFL